MKTIHYPLQYKREPTRVVRIGDLQIGGNNPILIQSMLTAATTDTVVCLAEIKALVAVNCPLIRLTIPSGKDLEAIPKLREMMKEEGIQVPLVADIHFSPGLAVDACELFEKIRINPGNYSDAPKNSGRGKKEETDFQEGYERLKEAVIPLVQNLKKYNRALRIGVNHGSLSSRMMEQYGDSPMGMVQSALEMIQIFEEFEFNQLIVSLKSSNPVVVQRAYRLLSESQANTNKVPLHLGVTEAGSGTMARIKSLAGIGSLLADGIGDTIRVSLTEDSPNEILFAEKLLQALKPTCVETTSTKEHWERQLTHKRVENREIIGNEITIGAGKIIQIGKEENKPLPTAEIPFTADFEYRKEDERYLFPQATGEEQPLKIVPTENSSLFSLRQFYRSQKAETPSEPIGMVYPVIPKDNFLQEIRMAGILSEGLLDFLLIPESMNGEQLERMLLLLQATRSKTYVTDYIACPSCGRTLFDLQTTTEKIKKSTNHLKGVKIGIMGCIVNGPGEMADADFGYVGSGKGKIDLYYGQTRVKRGIREEEALQALIALIQEKGMWIAP